MPYGPWDEYFVHQLPSPMDVVHDSDPSWSDRCYFNVHAPDDSLLIVTGYGNNPNQQRSHGYAKVTLADGRHWDLDAHRHCSSDRGDLYAGPMRWTCIEPLQRWTLEVGPNDSGIEWELHYESKAPMWELLPLRIRKRGRTLADMHHIKQPARYTGWVAVDGKRFEIDGWTGGRDRTFGVRVSEQVDFWLWFEAVFEDRAIEAWVFESADGQVQYVDGGFTHDDGSLSKRFVRFEHDIRFDGGMRRPAAADIVFTDEDGRKFAVTATALQQLVNVYYGVAQPNRVIGEGGVIHARWDASNTDEVAYAESGALSMDQLMHFECDGMHGAGIFELFVMGDGYPRYPNWSPVEMPRR
jgi:hypothetical protein